MKNLIHAALAAVVALALSACATIAPNGHVDAERVAIAAEQSYATVASSSANLAILGELPAAKVKAADAKAYAVLVAGRAVNDVVRPPSDAMVAARQSADLAHAAVQNL